MCTKHIYCEHCGDEIEHEEDLVVANKGYRMKVFHDQCYAQELKGMSTIFVNNNPCNGAAAKVYAIVLYIIGTAMLFVEGYRWFFLIVPLQALSRLSMWYKYIKPFRDRQKKNE